MSTVETVSIHAPVRVRRFEMSRPAEVIFSFNSRTREGATFHLLYRFF